MEPPIKDSPGRGHNGHTSKSPMFIFPIENTFQTSMCPLFRGSIVILNIAITLPTQTVL